MPYVVHLILRTARTGMRVRTKGEDEGKEENEVRVRMRLGQRCQSGSR